MKKWDLRFLELAKHIAQWSKDPSTKTGAVIVDQKRRIVSMGYNGFPMGVYDYSTRYEDRILKYKMIVHCEMNALLLARGPVEGCTLYTWPLLSCSRCAANVIQSGIIACAAPNISEGLKERWGEELDLSLKMFKEAKVEVRLYEE